MPGSILKLAGLKHEFKDFLLTISLLLAKLVPVAIFILKIATTGHIPALKIRNVQF